MVTSISIRKELTKLLETPKKKPAM